MAEEEKPEVVVGMFVVVVTLEALLPQAKGAEKLDGFVVLFPAHTEVHGGFVVLSILLKYPVRTNSCK